MQPEKSGAKITKQTPNAESGDDDELAQMLQQSIAEARANKALAEVRLVEIQKKDVLLDLDQVEITKLKRIVAISDELIKKLEKQCSSFTFLCIFKWKKC